MDYLDRDNTFSSVENRYFRKTPVSRSIKQNGEFLFSTPKRRTPMTPYVPPYRRKYSVDDDFPSSTQLGETLRAPAQVFGISRSEREPNIEKEFYKERIHEENINQVFHHEVKQKFTIENDSKNITQQILKLAKNYMNFEFKKILYDIYFDKYKEKLPKEYLNAIKFCISLDLADSINNFLDFESHMEENNEENRFLKNKEGEIDNKNYGPKNSSFCQEEITKPRSIELNDLSKEFWALIYSCNSFTDIKGVIMDSDHFGKVEILADEMKIFYKFEKLQKVIIEENCYYAIFDGSWHRVQCIKCNGSNAEVVFIDRGDTDNVSIDRLFKLDPKFLKLPAQAIHMSLLDLETFTDCDGTHEILDELLFEKAVYVIVKESSEEKKLHLAVQLYINKEDETVNINELIAQKLFKTVLNPLYDIQEGKAQHIQCIQTNTTGLFIQLNTTSLKYFKLLMEALIKKYCYDKNFKKQKVVRFECNQIYFVRRSRDNKFYRAKILKFKDDKVIEVLLIDTGIVTIINREDFFLLEKLSTILAQYPEQAIGVQLDQITILHSKILDHLEAVTFKSNALYVKFINIEKENNNIPVVHLYKKVNDYLISINDALLLEYYDILQNKTKMSSKNKLKLAGDNFDENKPKSKEDNFYENKPKSREDNFYENKPKSREDICYENKPKSREDICYENKPISKEDICYENKPKSKEDICYENKPKSREDNFYENKPKSREDICYENKPKSREDICYENKPKSKEDNFYENKPKSKEDNFYENKPKSKKDICYENKPKSKEDNFYENKPKLSECRIVEDNFNGNILKSAESNFDGSILKSAEYNFDKNKPKSYECRTIEDNFNGSILESAEGNVDNSILKLAKYNFDKNKPKLAENNFNEGKSKLVEDNLDETKQKLAEENFSEIKQKYANNHFDESLKKNIAELERLKLFQAELTRSMEEVDCTNLYLSTLLCAPLVPKDNYFDIHVTIAKDPSHFAFQFLKSRSVELKKMIHEMNAVSVNYRGPKLTYKSVCVGHIYVYRCVTNSQMWYRVYLLKIKDKNVASVYFCDYGHYKDVNIENLNCLQNQFYSLPYQAIWAKLYGVKPVSGHWTEKDCSRFKELIESKDFVCSVKGIKNVKVLNRNKSVPVTVENIYVVQLIDTSTDEDLYIADILINNGHALNKNDV